MLLHTTSEVISLAKKLENESAELYEQISGQYEKDGAAFLSFSKENERNVKQVERVYYGTISDAIECNFAFNLEKDKYSLDTGLDKNKGYPQMLEKVLSIEKLITGFYLDAAEQSRSLMADIPRVFKLLAQKRAERIEKLESLLKSEAGS
ncbi:hypothetical protein ACFLW5_01505 [Chloroflexota bacterium]